MNYLLVAVNASFSHTCLAVRSIGTYVNKKLDVTDSSLSVSFCEYTINQQVGEIIRGIAAQNPDFVMFSTYIWNAEIITKLIPELKNIMPSVVICAGGPEFGFAAEKYLDKIPELDFVICGEGEETVLDIVCSFKNGFESSKLEDIKGICFRKDSKNVFTAERELICDLSVLQFPYPELIDKNEFAGTGNNSGKKLLEFMNSKMFYYESSRGCPFSCSYCMSSIDKRVRFMPLQRVFDDLKIFLDAEVPLVKFVDRTYNLNEERYIEIWKYIVENHNKITMFHFEIEAEFLSEKALDFLQSVPSGVMQFEIGVQSANKKTLEAVQRSSNVEKLASNIKRIPRTIHQHLDLIAGLPYENLESFGKSFDFVMELKPDALQLGFLKVLHGTKMEEYAKNNGWKWMKSPVYETFSTPYLDYNQMMYLKDVEILVDAYWNSGKFVHVMNFIGRTLGFWKFFTLMTDFADELGVFEAARRETFWFELLAKKIDVWNHLNHGNHEGQSSLEQLSSELNFSVQNTQFTQVLYDLLRYDFVLRGKQGGYPEWYCHRYDKERHRMLLEENGGVKNARLDFAYSEYEVFDYDVDEDFPELKKGEVEKLIRYRKN